MAKTKENGLSFVFLQAITRRMRRHVAKFRFSLLQALPAKIPSLSVAPNDLRVTDPLMAEDMLTGRFLLAGRALECGNSSPFAQEAPSPAFTRALHSFRWLRHMRAHKSRRACQQARMLVDDWIRTHKKRKSPAWDEDVLGARIIAWLSHSPIVLQDFDSSFYNRFSKSLSIQVAYAQAMVQHSPDGLVRLRLCIALAMASLAMNQSPRQQRVAAKRLDLELERQILPDGGHISRNPQAILQILFDLLPLKQTYINLGRDIPQRLIPTIDRMFPALRFFRHADGALALFNGASATLANELSSVLRFDESAGQPFKALPNSHFQRLAAGQSVVLVDCGPAERKNPGQNAHAGALSFEFSANKQRFVINSGAPRFGPERYQAMARSTAAHSTLILGDVSSLQFAQNPLLENYITGGVTKLPFSRRNSEDGSDQLMARHNGYAKRFGLLHERDLRLNATGTKLVGHDRLLTMNGEILRQPLTTDCVIRFHIHPLISLTHEDDHSILLEAPSGESWLFHTPTALPEISEDVFFAGTSGIEPSSQIELKLETPEIWWFFSKR